LKIPHGEQVLNLLCNHRMVVSIPDCISNSGQWAACCCIGPVSACDIGPTSGCLPGQCDKLHRHSAGTTTWLSSGSHWQSGRTTAMFPTTTGHMPSLSPTPCSLCWWRHHMSSLTSR